MAQRRGFSARISGLGASVLRGDTESLYGQFCGTNRDFGRFDFAGEFEGSPSSDLWLDRNLESFCFDARPGRGGGTDA